jgi:hypothetical protein
MERELRITPFARTREKGPHGHRAQPVALRLANVQRVWVVENLFQTTEHESCCKRATETRVPLDRMYSALWSELIEKGSYNEPW